jgi:nucleotide-binding universal stress UspA family protein
MNMTDAIFKNILVGVNDTSESERAVEVAFSLAQAVGARVILLSVIEPLSPDAEAEGVGLDQAASEREQLKEHLRQTAERGRELKLNVSTELADGDPREEIERKAEADSADLIIVGKRDIGRVSRWLEGSTSEALVQAAKSSVLVVHED